MQQHFYNPLACPVPDLPIQCTRNLIITLKTQGVITEIEEVALCPFRTAGSSRRVLSVDSSESYQRLGGDLKTV